jgi:hypothetical protein
MALVATVVAAACGGRHAPTVVGQPHEPIGPDAAIAPPPGADAAPAAGGRVFLSWSILKSGSFASCADVDGVKIETIGTTSAPFTTTVYTCQPQQAVTGVLPPGNYVLRATLVGAGERLLAMDPDAAFVAVVDADVGARPFRFEVLDEPEAQMETLFILASALLPQNPGPADQFPATVGPTPDPRTCCATPHAICHPNPTLWTGATWQALGFALRKRHRWSYAFESSGSGAAATFTIVAQADLDCDQVYSRYELTGSVDASGAVVSSGIQRLVDTE